MFDSGKLEYQIWATHKTYAEEPRQVKLMAVFRFLQEAIDYCVYVTGNNCDCMLVGTCGFTSHYRPGANKEAPGYYPTTTDGRKDPIG